MEAKTTRQEFCSDKCRVYWNRENASDENLKKEIANDPEITEILEDINNLEPPTIKPKSRFQEILEQADKELKTKK